MSEQTTLGAIRDELFPRAYEIELDGETVWVDASIAGDIQGPLVDIAIRSGDATMAQSLDRALSRLNSVRRMLERAGLRCDSRRPRPCD